MPDWRERIESGMRLALLTEGIARVALAAADYSLEHGMHFADALVYATARRHHSELYTSDTALRHLPRVRFV